MHSVNRNDAINRMKVRSGQSTKFLSWGWEARKITSNKHSKILANMKSKQYRRIPQIPPEERQALGLDKATCSGLSKKIMADIEAEIIAAENEKNGQSRFDFKIDAPIDKKKQLDLTFNLFRTQAQFKSDKSKELYRNDIGKWRDSGPSRARLVIIESHSALPLGRLAKIIMEASPLERLLIVDLNEDKQSKLESELKKLWKEKFKSQSHLNSIKKIIRESPSKGDRILDTTSIDELIDTMNIAELMGPHLFQGEPRLGKDDLEGRHGQIFGNIEEVLGYGTKNTFFKEITSLATNISDGVPSLGIRARTDKKNGKGAWTYIENDNNMLLEHIASSKAPRELLFENGDESKPRVSMEPRLEALTSKKELVRIMKKQGLASRKHIEDSDIDSLKKMLFEEPLHEPYISPNSLDTTISAATSIIQVNKAEDVAKELFKNIYGKFTSTAVELNYAIFGMTVDGGSDQIQENLRKTNSYKIFYQNVLNQLRAKGIGEKKAIRIAFAQTMDAYLGIEKLNSEIYKLLNSETGAEANRNFGLIYTNKVSRLNKIGLKILAVAPYLFVAGIVTIGVGIAVLVPPLAETAATTALAASTMALELGNRIVSALSTRFQMKANARALTKANIALAEANFYKNLAQAKRDNLLARRSKELNRAILSEAKESLETSLGAIHKTSKKALKYSDNIPRQREIKQRAFQWRKKVKALTDQDRDKQLTVEGKKRINKKVRILINEDIGGTGKVEKNTRIDEALVENHTKSIFKSIARRINVSAREDYNNDLKKLLNSGDSRSRLVIIQADLFTAQQLAEITYNASPQDIVLLADLDDKIQQNLGKVLRALWEKRLENSSEDLAVAAKMAAKSLASSLLDQFEKEHKEGRGRDIANFCGWHGLRLNDVLPILVKKGKRKKKMTKLESHFEENIFMNQNQTSDLNIKTILNHLDTPNLIRPHLVQSDNDIDIETLRQRFGEFEVNLEEILVMADDEKFAENTLKLGLAIGKDGIPTFSIKANPFPSDYEGDYKCACKDSTKVFEKIASSESVPVILGIEEHTKSEPDLSMLSDRKGDTLDYPLATVSPIYASLFNYNSLRGQLPTRNHLKQEDLSYMKAILFDRALYEANMSPKKSTQTISKSNSKLGALAGEYVAKSLILNIVGQPKNILEEIKYSIAFMSLDTGVDLVNQNMQSDNFYRSLYDNLLEWHKETLETDQAIEKAFLETLDFYLKIKTDPDLKKEWTVANLSRKLAYKHANQSSAMSKESKRNIRPLWIFSLVGLVSAIVGVATLGASIPVQIGIGLTVLGISMTITRLGLLGLGLKEVVNTNNEKIPRSNRLSKNATFGFTALYEKIRERRDQELCIIKEERSKNEKSSEVQTPNDIDQLVIWKKAPYGKRKPKMSRRNTYPQRTRIMIP